MSNRTRWVRGLVAAWALSAGLAARAQLIFDNLGNNNRFQTDAGDTIGYIDAADHQEVAIEFTAAQSLYLDYAELELWPDLSVPRLSADPRVDVAVLTNASGYPGVILDSGSSGLPTQPYNPYPLTRIDFSDDILLTAGVQYWLAVAGADIGTTSAWEFEGNPVGVVVDSRAPGGLAGPWETPNTNAQGGARIFGTALPNEVPVVPEPGTYGACAVLLVGLLAICRRRIGIRVT